MSQNLNSMSRTTERLIDLAAMFMLLFFCYLFRVSQPALAGLVIGAAIQFWMSKNASAPDSPAHREAAAAIEAAAKRTEAAAQAAAEVLRTAQMAASVDRGEEREGERRGEDQGPERGTQNPPKAPKRQPR